MWIEEFNQLPIFIIGRFSFCSSDQINFYIDSLYVTTQERSIWKKQIILSLRR